MDKKIFSGFSARLQVLAIFTIIPILISAVFSYFQVRKTAIDNARVNALELMNISFGSYDKYVGEAKEILNAVSADSTLLSCSNASIQKYLLKHPAFVEIGGISGQGVLICDVTIANRESILSINPLPGLPINNQLGLRFRGWGSDVSYEDVYKTSITTRSFNAGSHKVEVGAGRSYITFALPFTRFGLNANGPSLQDVNQSEIFISFTTLDLGFLAQELANKIGPSDEKTFTVFDKNGIVLVHEPNIPELLGTSPDAGKEITRTITGQKVGTIDTEGFDGKNRFYAFTELGGESRLYFALGIPEEALYAAPNRTLRNNLIIFIIALFLALVVAYVSGRPLVLKKVAAIEEIDRLKSEFVSLASHQLRTPLTSIRWFTEILLNRRAGDITNKQKEFLEEVHDSSIRLISLVHDLLNISRIETQRLSINPVPTDIKTFLPQIEREIKPQLETKGIHYEFSYPENIPPVFLDPLIIRQVLLNLLSNSIKYTHEKGGIKLLVETVGTKIKFVISDTGVGIPKQEQKKVFERFFRASNVQTYFSEGTGLGLFIVKSLVSLSGGEVNFMSEENKGSTFWFTLPLSGASPRDGNAKLE